MLDTRDKILTVASNLIHSRSYADVGVAEICKVAGVQKGSFYHYFESKQDLSLCVLEGVVSELRHRLITKAFDPDFSAHECVERLADEIFLVQQEWTRRNGKVIGCPVGNLASELATQDEQVREAIVKAFQELEDKLYETLDTSLSQEKLSDLDARATARAMVAYIEGVLLISKTHNDLNLMKSLLHNLCNIKVKGALSEINSK